MSAQKYWKAKHLPSQEYLKSGITGTTLRTSRTGSKWYSLEELGKVLTSTKYKKVSGQQVIPFDKHDFYIEEYHITLATTMKFKENV